MAVFLFWASVLAIVAMFILIPVLFTMTLKGRPGRRTPGVDVQTHEYRGGKRVPPRQPARVIRLDQVRQRRAQP